MIVHRSGVDPQIHRPFWQRDADGERTSHAVVYVRDLSSPSASGWWPLATFVQSDASAQNEV